MKLMNLNHISLLPFLTCNFKCSYCIAHLPRFYRDKKPFGLWEERYDDVFRFIKRLDKKMILASGGEPLLWDRWEHMILHTDHYWYFVTNTSRIPEWLGHTHIKEKVKLFLSAFHRSGIEVKKYIGNVKRLQDMGYPVFCKIMWVGKDEQLAEAEEIIKAGIPMSFTPLVNGCYHTQDIMRLKPYCQSDMYFDRFFDIGREVGKCVAGTRESFQVDGLALTRCGHYSSISLNRVPKLLRGLYNGYVGDIYKPKYHQKPKICHKLTCFCENFHFSEILDGSENERWQKFIDTGKWVD